MAGFLKHLRNCTLDCGCQSNPCDPCGSCGSITAVTYRTRSATKTKCGHAEFVTPSSPPKIYLVQTFSGSVTSEQNSAIGCSGDCNSKVIDTFSGGETYTRPGCTAAGTGNRNTKAYDSGGAPCDTLQTDSDQAISALSDFGTGYTFAETKTQRSNSGDGCLGDDLFSGTATETLSNEYTTADLDSDALGAMLAASWSAYGASASSALFSQSGDEMTITKRAMGIKVTFPAASSGCKLCYDVFLDAVFLGTNTISLTAGQTEFTDDIIPPATPGAYTVDNFSLTTGSC
jgi:hypothetical protein